MTQTRPSACGRFVVVNDLHLDRAVFDDLTKWAERRGLTLQDAIQLALCFYDERLASAPDVRKTREDVESQSNPALP